MDKKRKQIAFEILPELHQQIKISAAKRNISMTLWMQRAIQASLKEEKLYD
jgi:predicted HicB family RNase H-like nuclease